MLYINLMSEKWIVDGAVIVIVFSTAFSSIHDPFIQPLPPQIGVIYDPPAYPEHPIIDIPV